MEWLGAILDFVVSVLLGLAPLLIGVWKWSQRAVGEGLPDVLPPLEYTPIDPEAPLTPIWLQVVVFIGTIAVILPPVALLVLLLIRLL